MKVPIICVLIKILFLDYVAAPGGQTGRKEIHVRASKSYRWIEGDGEGSNRNLEEPWGRQKLDDISFQRSPPKKHLYESEKRRINRLGYNEPSLGSSSKRITDHEMPYEGQLVPQYYYHDSSDMSEKSRTSSEDQNKQLFAPEPEYNLSKPKYELPMIQEFQTKRQIPLALPRAPEPKMEKKSLWKIMKSLSFQSLNSTFLKCVGHPPQCSSISNTPWNNQRTTSSQQSENIAPTPRQQDITSTSRSGDILIFPSGRDSVAYNSRSRDPAVSSSRSRDFVTSSSRSEDSAASSSSSRDINPSSRYSDERSTSKRRSAKRSKRHPDWQSPAISYISNDGLGRRPKAPAEPYGFNPVRNPNIRIVYNQSDSDSVRSSRRKGKEIVKS